MKQSRVTWTVLDYASQPPKFKCLRCGETREAHIPASITGFVKQGEAFMEDHKNCQPITLKQAGKA